MTALAVIGTVAFPAKEVGNQFCLAIACDTIEVYGLFYRLSCF